jgi:tetratricopeptide (TPR) repeat protein
MTSNYLQLGEFATAMRLVEEWTQRNALQDDLLGTHALLLHISQGKLQNGIGNFEMAVAAFETAGAAYRDDCHGHFHTPFAWGLGLAYALAGRISQALVQFASAEAHAEKIGSTAYMHTRLRHVACGLIEAGRYDEAARMATEAITLSRKGGIRPVEAGALALLGEINKRQGQPSQEMERRVLDALALAEALEMRPLAARCHLLLAWLYDKRRRPPERENHATAARSLIQQIGCVRLDAAGVS